MKKLYRLQFFDLRLHIYVVAEDPTEAEQKAEQKIYNQKWSNAQVSLRNIEVVAQEKTNKSYNILVL